MNRAIITILMLALSACAAKQASRPNQTAVPQTSAPNLPYAQMVLIDTKTQGVSPEGWGPVEEPPGFDSSNVRYWEHNTMEEYNTMDMNGRPIDMSQRHSIVKVLSKPQDAQTIADYSNPEFVLGWKPVLQ